MDCSTAESMVNRYIDHPAMMNWKPILLSIRRWSSWMKTEKTRFWIFGSCLKRIFVKAEDIS